MSDTLTVRRKISNLQDPYYCVWLQEMAGRGYILEKTGIIRDRFKVTEPQKRLYRVLGKHYDSMDAEEQALYEEAGWEKVYASGEYTLMTNSDVSSPEIFSDRDSYVKSIRGRWIGLVLLIGYWCFMAFRSGSALVDLVGGGDYAHRYGHWHALEGKPLLMDFILLVLGILTIAYIIIIVNDWLKLLRGDIRKDMPSYDTAYDDPDYLKAKRMSKASDCLAVVVVVLFAAALIGYISYKNAGTESGAEALKYDGEHPVMLREIDPAGWDEIVPLIEKADESGSADTGSDSDLNSDVDTDAKISAASHEPYYTVGYMALDESGGIFREAYREQMQMDRLIRHYESDGESADIETNADIDTNEGEGVNATGKGNDNVGGENEDDSKSISDDTEEFTEDFAIEAYYMSAYKVARSEYIAEEYLGEEIASKLYGKVDKGAWRRALEAARLDPNAAGDADIDYCPAN